MFAAVSLALVLGGLSGPVAEAAPSPERLATWATEAPARVLPVLEEVTGRHLAEVPEVRFVDRDAFLGEEGTRVFDTVKAANPDAPPEELVGVVDAYVHSIRHVSAAYEYERGRLYVVYEPLATALDFAPPPTEAATAAAVACAVAHELTHALQRQEVGDPPEVDDPSTRAASAMREGHAVWAAYEVCRRLGQPAAATWHLVAQGALREREQPEKDFVYRLGFRTVQRAAEAGGSEAAWALVREPPDAADMEAEVAAEEAGWTALGAGVEAAARPWRQSCLVRREWRPEELRTVRPPVLAPPQEVLSEVRWLSWCGLDPGSAVGHAVLAPGAPVREVAALLRERFSLPTGPEEPLDAPGFDTALRWCDEHACTFVFTRGDRLALVAAPTPANKAARAARKLLAGGRYSTSR